MRLLRLIVLALVAIFGTVALATAQFTWSNGTLGFYLSNAGNFRAGVAPYSSSTRDISRMTIVVAQTPTMVFDFNNDQNSTTLEPAAPIKVAGVDTTVEVLTDNSYSNTPPKIKVRITVMSWKNVKYAIVRYRVINDTTVTLPLWVGAHILPYVSATWGGETIKYSTASKTGYFYRQGTAKYWGLRLLGKNPTSFRAMDWNAWSTDPGTEVTTDSMRYAVTATGGFDSVNTASADGSIMQLNAGQSSVAKSDSSTTYYALAFGTSVAEMLASVDSAVAKFGKVFTAVQEYGTPGIPDRVTLQQNYPNPFNPSTRIEFSLPGKEWARVSVFDVLGRQVATLAEGVMSAGVHVADFNAANLTSGVYLVRLETAGAVQSRRMMLLK